MKEKLKNLIVAIVLLLACIFSFAMDNSVAKVGAGLSGGRKVEDVQDLLKVLESLDPNGVSSKVGSSIVPLALGGSSNKKSKNATITETTRLRVDNGKANTVLERQLDVYMTSRGTYYTSKGVMRGTVQTYNKDYKSSEYENVVMKFDLNIYVVNENVYMQIFEFMYAAADTHIQIKYSEAGEWFKCSEEVAEALLTANTFNHDFLGDINDMFTELVEEGVINEDDKRVSLTENDLKRLDSYYDEDVETEITLNLTVPNQPYITWHTYYYDNKQAKTYKNDDIIVIKNIGNTEVDFNRSAVKKSIDTIDELEEIFVINGEG